MNSFEMKSLESRLCSDLEPTVGSRVIEITKRIMSTLHNELPRSYTSYQYTYLFMRASALAAMTTDLSNGYVSLAEEYEITRLINQIERQN